MFPLLRDLQADNPDGVEGVIEGINHVVRSKPEIKAKANQHFLAAVSVKDSIYVDVVDTDRELKKGDLVKIEWTTTDEGDGMPILV